MKKAKDEPTLYELENKVDDRGFLVQIFGSFPGNFPQLKRVYLVGNFSRGVVRGLHKHKKEWKGYHVATGAAKFVVLRDGKDPLTFVLSEKRSSILVVPPTFYHGWVSLADRTLLVGLSSASLEESQSDDMRKDPLTLGEEIWRVRAR